jgi:hypothetical protein
MDGRESRVRFTGRLRSLRPRSTWWSRKSARAFERSPPHGRLSHALQGLRSRFRFRAAGGVLAAALSTLACRAPPLDGSDAGHREALSEDCGSPAKIACPEAIPSEAALADELFSLINRLRVRGFACPPSSQIPSARALERSATLDCFARAQSLDIAARGFFDHTNPDGLGAQESARSFGFVAL